MNKNVGLSVIRIEPRKETGKLVDFMTRFDLFKRKLIGLFP